MRYRSVILMEMELTLDIAQGVGLALAAGIRPFLPLLLVGVLARANLGIDFGGTDYYVLERVGMLLTTVVALCLAVFLQRRVGFERFHQGTTAGVFAAISALCGAVLFAGSLADHGYLAWPGLIAGLLVSGLAYYTAAGLLSGASRRLDTGAREALTAYSDGCSLLLAAVAVLAPPVSVLALPLFVGLTVSRRRQRGRKHAGLRILR